MTTMARRSLLILGLGIALIASTAACNSDSSSKTSASKPAATTSTTAAPTDVAVYAKPGPYKVGYTTLHMAESDVAVWYPADDDAVEDQPKATYDQRTPLPDNLKSLVPDQYNTVFTMDAYADVAGSADGPFPVVLYSHGLSAYRLVASALSRRHRVVGLRRRRDRLHRPRHRRPGHRATSHAGSDA